MNLNLTKGKINKLYNTKSQSFKKCKKNKKGKSTKCNRTFRKNNKVNLAKGSLKRRRKHVIKGGNKLSATIGDTAAIASKTTIDAATTAADLEKAKENNDPVAAINAASNAVKDVNDISKDAKNLIETQQHDKKDKPEDPAEESDKKDKPEDPAEESDKKDKPEDPAEDSDEKDKPEDPAEESDKKDKPEDPVEESDKKDKPEDPAEEPKDETNDNNTKSPLINNDPKTVAAAEAITQGIIAFMTLINKGTNTKDENDNNSFQSLKNAAQAVSASGGGKHNKTRKHK